MSDLLTHPFIYWLALWLTDWLNCLTSFKDLKAKPSPEHMHEGNMHKTKRKCIQKKSLASHSSSNSHSGQQLPGVCSGRPLEYATPLALCREHNKNTVIRCENRREENETSVFSIISSEARIHCRRLSRSRDCPRGGLKSVSSAGGGDDLFSRA